MELRRRGAGNDEKEVGMAVWKRICCPVDFSSASRTAMQEAAELAWRFGGDLMLVHVDPRPSLAGETLVARESREQRAVELERNLAAWADEAEPIATTTVEHVLLAGEPAEEIARFAREGGYDVIVMGTRGQTGHEGWGLGSVAQAIVRKASCTVVVVRGRISRAAERLPSR
jgi:nucleotide-binding universal stress UspA family protein